MEMIDKTLADWRMWKQFFADFINHDKSIKSKWVDYMKSTKAELPLCAWEMTYFKSENLYLN